MLDAEITEAQASDYASAYRLAESSALEGARFILADKGYDSARFRQMMEARGLQPVIPPRCHHKAPAHYDRERYKDRNVVERLIGRLKENRRIAMRFDKLAHMFEGFVVLAAVRDSLKRSFC